MGPEFSRLVENRYGAYVVEVNREMFNSALYSFKEPALGEEQMQESFGGWFFHIVRHYYGGYTVDTFKDKGRVSAFVVWSPDCSLAVVEV